MVMLMLRCFEILSDEKNKDLEYFFIYQLTTNLHGKQ